MCSLIFFLQGMDPWPAISFKITVLITYVPKKEKYITWLEDLICIHTGGIYRHQMPQMHLLAWQAHYDLKDPKGLAGFLIDSDIKLVRAEWGSPDESSRHKSQGDMKRNQMHKMKKNKVSNWHSLYVFSPQVGMVWSIVGLQSWVWLESCSMLWKTRIWKVPHRLWFQVSQEFAGRGWSFPSEAGSWNHDLHRCYWGITFCIGEPWRSTSMGRWVPWLPTCWVSKFDETVTSFCNDFITH